MHETNWRNAWNLFPECVEPTPGLYGLKGRNIHRVNYLPYVPETIRGNHGSAMVAMNEDTVIGFAAGMLESKDQEDKLTNRCPARGVITELIIAPAWRGKGVGKKLVEALEKRFKEMNCEYSAVDVFGSNKSAQFFYGNSYFTSDTTQR